MTPGRLTKALGGGSIASRLPDGRVLVADPFGTGLEIYDPATGTSRAVATAHMATSGATATVLADGRVLVAGGAVVWSPSGWGIETTILDTAHLYDPHG